MGHFTKVNQVSASLIIRSHLLQVNSFFYAGQVLIDTREFSKLELRERYPRPALIPLSFNGLGPLIPNQQTSVRF